MRVGVVRGSRIRHNLFMALRALSTQIAVAFALALLSASAWASQSGETTVELTSGRFNGSAGTPIMFVDAVAKFPWLPCDATGSKDELSGSFRFFVDGLEYPAPASSFPSCDAGAWRLGSYFNFWDLLYGEHEVIVEFSGNAKLAPARSNPITISHQPMVATPLADGATLNLWVGDPFFPVNDGRFWHCSLDTKTGAAGTPGWPAQPPPHASLIAIFSIESLGCQFVYSHFATQEPIAVPPIARRVLAGRDPPLPEGTIAYAYGPTRDDASPHWYELPTSTAGNQAHFLIVDGGSGDESLTMDGRVRTLVALALPQHSAIAGRYQDLWWAGLEENGWGLSLTQHRDVLFGELFIYDAQGAARWLAMPSGQWNAARTAYTGLLYRPRGTPYTATYDASQFVIGPAVGTLTLTPSSLHAMRLEYVIDGVRGSKPLERIPFGPAYATPQLPFDDLWWGGAAQNGWGVVVAQQYRSFFTLWYTYDEQGEATWFVAPSSTFTPFFTTNMDATRYGYKADLFRPRGSPWIGANYDPALHSLEKIGSISMSFGSDTGYFTTQPGTALSFGSDKAYFTTQIGAAFRSTGISRLPF